jgi:hypothetical protein
MPEVANKRLPVTPKTWEELSGLKRPGETYDELLHRLLEMEAGLRLSHELQALERDTEEFEELN